MDIVITKNGFSNSIGCSRAIEPISIHLFEPFTSIPITGTRIKKIKQITNNTIDILNKLAWLIDEKKRIKRIYFFITYASCYS